MAKLLKRLPGSQSGSAHKAHHFLVIFDMPSSPSSEFDRSRIVNSGMNAARHNVENLKSFVIRNGLEADLVSIGRPTSIGTVGIVGTTRLAKKLRQAPEVREIIAD